MTSGWQEAPYFRRYDGGELISKPPISLKKSWGGLTSERLSTSPKFISLSKTENVFVMNKTPGLGTSNQNFAKQGQGYGIPTILV